MYGKYLDPGVPTNWSEFLTLLKQQCQLSDIPLPVNDVEITERFQISALKIFSRLYPLIRDCIITSEQALNMDERSLYGRVEYIIPKKYYQGTEILDVMRVDASGYGSEAEMYMPSLLLGSADSMLESISEIKMAAALGSMMTHSPTHEFRKPDRLLIYNGWTTGSFRVELELMHDPSLSTVPDTAMTDLLELAVLVLKEYMYGKLKRKNNIDTGVGNIQLLIDEWSDAVNQKQQWINDKAETASFWSDTINWF